MDLQYLYELPLEGNLEMSAKVKSFYDRMMSKQWKKKMNLD